eukprot:scaffold154417_cov49-Prasinocladus_malaysianus.AAC.4
MIVQEREVVFILLRSCLAAQGGPGGNAVWCIISGILPVAFTVGSAAQLRQSATGYLLACEASRGQTPLTSTADKFSSDLACLNCSLSGEQLRKVHPGAGC